MAKKIKRHHRRKDLLREPDEFLSFSERAFVWSRANWPLVIIAAGVLAIVGVVGLLINSSIVTAKSEFRVSFREAIDTFDAPVEGQGFPLMPGMTMYSSEKEKYEAAEFKLEKLLNDYPDTELEPYIQLYLADSLLRQGKYGDAIEKYRALRQSHADFTDLDVLSMHNEAVALYSQEKHKEAFDIFKELADMDVPLQKASSLVYAGHCAEKLGKLLEAVEYYQRAVDSYSDSVLTNGLEAKIARLKIGAEEGEELPQEELEGPPENP